MNSRARLALIVGCGVAFLIVAALIKAFIAARGLDSGTGTGVSQWGLRLTLARLVVWVTWIPLLWVVWRITTAVDARVRSRVWALSIHGVASFGIALVHIALVVAVNVQLLEPVPSLPLFGHRFHRFVGSYLDWEVLVYWGVVCAIYAVMFAIRYRERELQAAQLESRLNSERLQALLAQLNPHFLFNTLNAVTGLVYTGKQDAAVATITRLASFLRLALDEGYRQEIPLRDEVGLLSKYLDIETVRFGNRLSVAMDIPAELGSALVPTLILQPLVENAIRHGIGRIPGPGAVHVSAARAGGSLVLSVRDSPGEHSEAKSGREIRAGVGIANTRERLERLYAGRAGLTLGWETGEGSVVRVHLPYHAGQT